MNVGFHWGSEEDSILYLLKDRLSFTLLLGILDFANTFKTKCDASSKY